MAMKFKNRRAMKAKKITKFSPDKRQKTGHKMGKGLNHLHAMKSSKKSMKDKNQDTPLMPTGRAPAENRADTELKRLQGE